MYVPWFKRAVFGDFLAPLQVFIKSELKVGVIYVKEGQYTEEEILDNNDNSPLFEEFLQILGEKVRLKGFDKYKGGLDTVHDLTGKKKTRPPSVFMLLFRAFVNSGASIKPLFVSQKRLTLFHFETETSDVCLHIWPCCVSARFEDYGSGFAFSFLLMTLRTVAILNFEAAELIIA